LKKLTAKVFYLKVKRRDQVTIFQHPEFEAFTKEMNALFAKWKKKSTAYLKELQAGFHPKEVIFELSESLLAQYTPART
jgi:type I restriction enzyme M protein